MTPEEKESIIVEIKDRIIEDMVLLLPKVMSDLLAEQSTIKGLGDKFFNDNPTFKSHTDVVVSVMQQMETENPGTSYEDVLKKATPEITNRIGLIKDVDITSINKPDTSKFGDHGEV